MNPNLWIMELIKYLRDLCRKQSIKHSNAMLKSAIESRAFDELKNNIPNEIMQSKFILYLINIFLVNNQIIIAKKDLERHTLSKAQSSSLMHATFTKLGAEDIYGWIRFGFKELVEKKNIKKTFETCGYIDRNLNEVVDEL